MFHFPGWFCVDDVGDSIFIIVSQQHSSVLIALTMTTRWMTLPPLCRCCGRDRLLTLHLLSFTAVLLLTDSDVDPCGLLIVFADLIG